MKTKMMADCLRYPRMTTQELRDAFLVEGLFESEAIHLTYVDLDRAVIGMAAPVERPLVLPTSPELRAASFTEGARSGH